MCNNPALHFAFLLSFFAPHALADVAAIHASALPQETAVLAALDDARQLEPYSHSWTNNWKYPVAKEDVAPVTSTIRGVPSEVVLSEEDGMKSPCAVNLHNAVTVSQERLGRRVAQLSAARMNEVCAALRFSLGCDSN